MEKKHSWGLYAVVLVIAALLVVAGVTGSDAGLAATAWALLPPVAAIALALITKEVYSSLFVGIVLGALMYSGFSPAKTLSTVVNDGMVAAVADSAGIFVFLVVLGIVVALVNRAGGSEAFGHWASEHVRTRAGACMATFLLGVLIFIDDYFNCLTVGSVMRPLTDSKGVSRVKLAYLIDATAAPVCMIAPISSWAAAVSGSVENTSMSGIELFVRAIPFNFYSLMTLVFIVAITRMGFDYGKMAEFEIKARPAEDGRTVRKDGKASGGSVADLMVPVLVLIVACVAGLLPAGVGGHDHRRAVFHPGRRPAQKPRGIKSPRLDGSG